ncbi:hypothetical protein M9H77_17028 [Catharanthus roseus]|uniref:Uncharacterized protein n=1 Tax=Catharanthus roseus TaxID=4058 RepID=A0ACC0B3F2_CATRO|nr:hypothetical protein M9H77_17028 [Catharanthus roseus]
MTSLVSSFRRSPKTLSADGRYMAHRWIKLFKKTTTSSSPSKKIKISRMVEEQRSYKFIKSRNILAHHNSDNDAQNLLAWLSLVLLVLAWQGSPRYQNLCSFKGVELTKVYSDIVIYSFLLLQRWRKRLDKKEKMEKLGLFTVREEREKRKKSIRLNSCVPRDCR